MIIEPISMAPGVHAVGNILYCAYKQFLAANKTKPLVSIKAGAGSNPRKIRVRDNRIELAHLGCGTSLGVPTHFSAKMIISPEKLIDEVNMMYRLNLVNDPWSKITCDPDAIIVTDYHKAWSQIFEMMSDETRGTCGSGAGRAYYFAELAPERAIYARDLTDLKVIKEKLTFLRDHVRDAVRNLSAKPDLSDDDRYRFTELQAIVEDIGNKRFELMANQFFVLGKRLELCTTNEVLDRYEGNAVVEFSHGVLSDAENGFKPYVSKMRTLPQLFDKYLREIGYKGKIQRIAVVCAYDYRHGPGPMPTYEPALRALLGIAPTPEEDRWRGPIRCGNLDIMQVRYAIRCCGGVKKFDGVWLTCFDQILSSAVKKPYIDTKLDKETGERTLDCLQTWPICVGYLKDNGVKYSVHRPGKDVLTTEFMQHVVPITNHYCLPDQTTFKDNKPAIYDFLAPIIEELIGLPLKAVSYGTSEKRKIWKK